MHQAITWTNVDRFMSPYAITRLQRVTSKSKSWLLKSWWHKDPGYQQPWYWHIYPIIFWVQDPNGLSHSDGNNRRISTAQLATSNQWPDSLNLTQSLYHTPVKRENRQIEIKQQFNIDVGSQYWTALPHKSMTAIPNIYSCHFIKIYM